MESNPNKKMKIESDGQNKSSPPEDETPVCTICQEPVTPPIASLAKCCHVFCAECFKKFFYTSIQVNKSIECPNCRTPITLSCWMVTDSVLVHNSEEKQRAITDRESIFAGRLKMLQDKGVVLQKLIPRNWKVHMYKFEQFNHVLFSEICNERVNTILNNLMDNIRQIYLKQHSSVAVLQWHCVYASKAVDDYKRVNKIVKSFFQLIAHFLYRKESFELKVAYFLFAPIQSDAERKCTFLFNKFNTMKERVAPLKELHQRIVCF